MYLKITYGNRHLLDVIKPTFKGYDHGSMIIVKETNTILPLTVINGYGILNHNQVAYIPLKNIKVNPFKAMISSIKCEVDDKVGIPHSPTKQNNEWVFCIADMCGTTERYTLHYPDQDIVSDIYGELY